MAYCLISQAQGQLYLLPLLTLYLLLDWLPRHTAQWTDGTTLWIVKGLHRKFQSYPRVRCKVFSLFTRRNNYRSRDKQQQRINLSFQVDKTNSELQTQREAQISFKKNSRVTCKMFFQTQEGSSLVEKCSRMEEKALNRERYRTSDYTR
jgi:hypothetical protein